MKLKLHQVQWTVWQICHDLDADLEIEIPDSLSDLIESVEESYSDVVALIEDLVQQQHGKDKVV